MKLKKILILILCLGISICLVGCGNQNTTNAVANNLDKNTTQLEKVLDKLQDVNYKNIVIEEISPLSDETFNTISNTKVLKKTKWYSVNGNKTSDFIPTKVSGEKRKDAKFVSQNNIKKIGLTSYESIPKNELEYTETPYKNYYQSTQKSVYKPKYINSVSENFNRDCLDNYIKQIEVIYEECADCIGCNAECKNQKVILQQNISDCRTLVKKMRDGTIQLSAENISTCNNCMNNLNECIDRLNSTKSNVSTKEKSILDLKNNFTTNKDKLETAYEKLLSSLENRLNALCECNDCLDCICNTINNSNIDMSDALENKTNESDIRDYEQEELEQEQSFPNIDTMNVPSINKNDYIQNTTLQNNQNISQQNAIPQGQVFGNGNGYYNNGYGYNGFGNGYGYNNYPYPPRNIDTYGYITKNIDTYRPYNQTTQIEQNKKEQVNENDETIDNKKENQETIENENNIKPKKHYSKRHKKVENLDGETIQKIVCYIK